MATAPGEVTRILEQIAAGDRQQESHLFDLLYPELRRLAVSYLTSERKNHTLQPTALVNEVYMRLMGGAPDRWANRNHFVGVAARAMRHILVDYARSQGAAKRGSNSNHVPIEDCGAYVPERSADILALHEALEKLEAIDPALGKLVQLRYFGGQTMDQIAAQLGVSVRKVQSDWEFARSWLRARMS